MKKNKYKTSARVKRQTIKEILNDLIVNDNQLDTIFKTKKPSMISKNSPNKITMYF
jgi:hypothetical protein